MTLDELVALAKSWTAACDRTGNSETASAIIARAVIDLLSEEAAQLVLEILDSPAAKLRGEIVEWAKRWRETPDIAPPTGNYEDDQRTVAEYYQVQQDGMALVDALAIAERAA